MSGIAKKYYVKLQGYTKLGFLKLFFKLSIKNKLFTLEHKNNFLSTGKPTVEIFYINSQFNGV